MSNPQSSIADPDLRALLNAHRDEVFGSLSAVRVGKIVSFDTVAQTATVELMAKRVVYNNPQPGGALQQIPTTMDYPVLTDVPVVVLGGGGAAGGFVECPIGQGDECVVFFNDGDLDNWFETGAASVPNSPRTHSLSDGIALVGIASKGNAKPLSSQVMGFRYAGNVIRIAGGGGGTYRIELKNANGAQFIIGLDGRFQAVDIEGVHFGTTGGKFYLYNPSNGLHQALDDLCAALTSWVNTGGSTPNPATLALIAAAKVKIDNILS